MNRIVATIVGFVFLTFSGLILWWIAGIMGTSFPFWLLTGFVVFLSLSFFGYAVFRDSFLSRLEDKLKE